MRHKNLDFGGSSGPLAKPFQIDAVGALSGSGQQIPILTSFGDRPGLPAKPIQIDPLEGLWGPCQRIQLFEIFLMTD